MKVPSILIVISQMVAIIHGGYYHEHPADYMADLTNDLGVKVLQILAFEKQGNVAFSPYGLASVSILLFEGSTDNTALEIYTTLKLPWNVLYTRFGFRDLNRHLKTYFQNDGFLRGLVMSRDNVCLYYSYQKLLRLYGFEEPDTALTYPCSKFVPYEPSIYLTTSTTSTTQASTTVTSNGTDTTTMVSETTTNATVPDTLTSPSETSETTTKSETAETTSIATGPATTSTGTTSTTTVATTMTTTIAATTTATTIAAATTATTIAAATTATTTAATTTAAATTTTATTTAAATTTTTATTTAAAAAQTTETTSQQSTESAAAETTTIEQTVGRILELTTQQPESESETELTSLVPTGPAELQNQTTPTQIDVTSFVTEQQFPSTTEASSSPSELPTADTVEPSPAESIQHSNIVPSSGIKYVPNDSSNAVQSAFVPYEHQVVTSINQLSRYGKNYPSTLPNHLIQPSVLGYSKESFVPKALNNEGYYPFMEIRNSNITLADRSNLLKHSKMASSLSTNSKEDQVPSTLTGSSAVVLDDNDVVTIPEFVRSVSLTARYGHNENRTFDFSNKNPKWYTNRRRSWWQKKKNQTDEKPWKEKESNNNNNNNNDTSSQGEEEHERRGGGGRGRKKNLFSNGWFKFRDIDEEVDKFLNSSSFRDSDFISSFESGSDSNETDSNSAEELSKELYFHGYGDGKAKNYSFHSFKKTKFGSRFTPRYGSGKNESNATTESNEDNGVFHSINYFNEKRKNLNEKIDEFFRKLKNGWKNCTFFTTDDSRSSSSSNEGSSEELNAKQDTSNESKKPDENGNGNEQNDDGNDDTAGDLKTDASYLSIIRTDYLAPLLTGASDNLKYVLESVLPFSHVRSLNEHGDTLVDSSIRIVTTENAINNNRSVRLNNTSGGSKLTSPAFETSSNGSKIGQCDRYGKCQIKSKHENYSSTRPAIIGGTNNSINDYRQPSSSDAVVKSRQERSVVKHDKNKTKDDYQKLWFDIRDNTNTIWFSVSDLRRVLIPTFFYSALLPFAYIPQLNSQVVELPLDDPRYSLVILLPIHRSGMNQLLQGLSYYPIRKLYAKLRPSAVYTTIPVLHIISQIDLKPAMYQLGVRDAFYRYRADFSKMSPDELLYVRSIEQVVTISVTQYPEAVYEIPKVAAEHYIIAAHPFVYLVLDKETKVSLVAGIMTDPSKQSISIHSY